MFLQIVRRFQTCGSPLLFQVSQTSFAEPMKKKKKIDPAILKGREDRKKRRIEREIRRLKKISQQLKPIDEFELPFHITENLHMRQRQIPTLSDEEVYRRHKIMKAWSVHKMNLFLQNMKNIKQVMASKTRALEELKEVSEELYNEAIQLDPFLIPFNSIGPVQTPPITNYESPDGDYQDTSRKWD